MKRWFILAALIGLMVLAGSVVSAQETGNTAGPLTGAEKATPVNWNSEIPVWKTGQIDAINSSGLVINDTRYRFTVETRFLATDGSELSIASFSRGEDVTFVLEADRVTVVSLIDGVVREEPED